MPVGDIRLSVAACRQCTCDLRSAHACMWLYNCIYIYIYIYAALQLHKNVRDSTTAYICMRLYICTCMYVTLHLHVGMYVLRSACTRAWLVQRGNNNQTCMENHHLRCLAYVCVCTDTYLTIIQSMLCAAKPECVCTYIHEPIHHPEHALRC
jgi:hypothetical protein